MQKQYLEAGKFVTTHGVTGEIKAYPYCDSAEFLCTIGQFYLSPQGGKALHVLEARPHKGMVLLRLEGVNSMDDARALVGRLFYLDRADADLPAGRWFVQDIIGLRVLDADTGAEYGTITAVTNGGASDVYEVRTGDGRTVLFPAAAEFLAETNPEAGYVKVRPIRGMFDDAD